MRSERGFTLMELLVVVAIVALLVGLVTVSMRTVRNSASRTRSLAALRTISTGHAQYIRDHAWRLLPGYIDTTLFGYNQEFEDLIVKRPSGTVLAPDDRQSYVWRLAPYVDDAWQTFFAETTDAGAMSRFNADFVADVFGPGSPSAAFGGICERPSFGMNSMFVGGDSLHGDEQARERSPWNTAGNATIAATRFTQILRPARLIVFGPAAKVGAAARPVYEDPEVGYCELRPPYYIFCCPTDTWIDPQWMTGERGLVQQTTTGNYDYGAGLPIDRTGGNRMPLAHADGSTAVEPIENLARDMRRWNPFEPPMLRMTAEPYPR
jgi:prepilin-type N-terminal cleavage/methylation domain-containing protein